MTTIYDLYEVTGISPHTTYSELNGNLLGVVDGMQSAATGGNLLEVVIGILSLDLDDGEFDEGDAVTIGGVNYTIDLIQEPASSGRFTLGDGTNLPFDPQSESNLDVVFLTVSNGSSVRHFIVPNDSYGDMNVQEIRTGEIKHVAGDDAAIISTVDNNTSVVCFTPGTLIETAKGDRPVEMLSPGDMICTHDNGLQPLLGLGVRHLGPSQLDRAPHLRPIEIAAGALGNDRDLVVSPQHGLLLQVGGEQQLVRAVHLAQIRGGAVRQRRGCRRVSYYHLFFEAHQIVISNGVPSESLYPGPIALRSLAPPTRREFTRLVPGLSRIEDEKNIRQHYGPSVRPYLKSNLLPDHLHKLALL